MARPDSPDYNSDFTETHWSIIAQASGDPSAKAVEALNRLCQIYWLPVYAYVRRKGHAPHDAQDLTQEFFLRLVEKRSYAAAKPTAGRFRSFLITALKNFLTDEWRKATAAKRGGNHTPLPLDYTQAEALYQAEASAELSPDALFQRRWRTTVLSRALENLRQEFKKAGKERQGRLLTPFLGGDGTAEEREETARELNTSTANVRTLVHRARKRLRHLVRQEIIQTVDNPQDAEDEMRHLFAG